MDSGCWCASFQAVREGKTETLKYLVSFPNICVNSEPCETILLLACRKQNLEIVSILLQHQKVKAIINKISHGEGLSALHLSIQFGQSETTCLPFVMALVEAGADVNISSREMMSPSCMSAYRGFVSVLAYLIDHGADVNTVDQTGCTVLHHIVTKPNACVILQKLIIAGIQINLQNRFGETPLYLATLSNNEGAVNMLLETNDSCVDLGDRKGVTPLMLAAMQNEIKIIKLLLQHGACVNKQDDRGRTSLIVAIRNGNNRTVDALLNMDVCDVNLSDNQGKSSLMLAVQRDSKELVEMLHQYGADINQQDNRGRTSLYLAVENNNFITVDVLLQMDGCDVNLSDNKGKSPFMLAVQNCNTELMELLHQHSADVNKQDGRGRSAVYYCLHLLCRDEDCMMTNSIEIMKLLECFGAEFKTQNRGNKLLKHVLKKNSYDYFLHLVESNKVDVDGLDKNGDNILHYLARCSITFPGFGTFLTDDRIDINHINSTGNTPLMVAAILYNTPYMQALLKHGCSTSIKNIYGHTVLHLSIIGFVKLIHGDYDYTEWDSELFAVILSTDIDVNARDKDGQTALILAAKLGHYKLVKQLCKAGADCKILDKFGKAMAHYLNFSGISDVKLCKHIIQICGVDITDKTGVTMMDVAMEFIETYNLTDAFELISYLIAANYCFQNRGHNKRNMMFMVPMWDPLSGRINSHRKLMYESGADRIDIVSKLPFNEDEYGDNDAQTIRCISKESEFHSFCNNICLKSLCRRIIRQHLGPNIQEKVTKLKVPLTVQNFLLLKCSLEDKYFNLETEDSDDDDEYDKDMEYDTDEFGIDLYDSEDLYDCDTCTSLSNPSSTSSLSSSPPSPSSLSSSSSSYQ
ncbi:hypothetical protein SNE40_005518 [Patella caerulea]|uniref:SOCS box domain-containing protein n=1 Tax=Patella caerulea TaxID=87958 RepID=A0AAN8PWJ5_PATCE